jgi:hypothetical protein
LALTHFQVIIAIKQLPSEMWYVQVFFRNGSL